MKLIITQKDKQHNQ